MCVPRIVRLISPHSAKDFQTRTEASTSSQKLTYHYNYILLDRKQGSPTRQSFSRCRCPRKGTYFKLQNNKYWFLCGRTRPPKTSFQGWLSLALSITISTDSEGTFICMTSSTSLIREHNVFLINNHHLQVYSSVSCEEKPNDPHPVRLSQAHEKIQGTTLPLAYLQRRISASLRWHAWVAKKKDSVLHNLGLDPKYNDSPAKLNRTGSQKNKWRNTKYNIIGKLCVCIYTYLYSTYLFVYIYIYILICVYIYI